MLINSQVCDRCMFAASRGQVSRLDGASRSMQRCVGVGQYASAILNVSTPSAVWDGPGMGEPPGPHRHPQAPRRPRAWRESLLQEHGAHPEGPHLRHARHNRSVPRRRAARQRCSARGYLCSKECKNDARLGTMSH